MDGGKVFANMALTKRAPGGRGRSRISWTRGTAPTRAIVGPTEHPLTIASAGMGARHERCGGAGPLLYVENQEG